MHNLSFKKYSVHKFIFINLLITILYLIIPILQFKSITSPFGCNAYKKYNLWKY